MAVARIDVGRSGELLSEGLAARRDLENAQIKVSDHAAKLAEARAKLSKVDIALGRQSVQLVRAPRDGRRPEGRDTPRGEGRPEGRAEGRGRGGRGGPRRGGPRRDRGSEGGGEAAAPAAPTA